MDRPRLVSFYRHSIRMVAMSLVLASFVSQSRAGDAGHRRDDDRGGAPQATSPDEPPTSSSPSSQAAGAPASQPADEPCESLQAEVAAATGPAQGADACLRAAHCILVKQCALPLSAELAGFTDSRRVLADYCRAGLSLLDRAEAALADGQVDEGEASRLRDRIDLLRAFGGLFDALARNDGSQHSHRRILAACKRLGVYLDDSDEAVVESAKLWQGVAYRRAGRPDRSLQVLRPIIAAPISRRIGFLARIERCRALGEAGEHAAGLALCNRLGARADTWFADEDDGVRKKAADTVRFVRAELYLGWAAKLRAAGEETAADQAAVEAKRLTGPDATSWPESWMGLDESIAGISDWKNGPSSDEGKESNAEG